MTGSPVIGPAGWGFLAFAGLLLPVATVIFALGERRRGREVDGNGDPTAAHEPARVQLYAQALFTHVVLFGVTAAVAGAERLTLVPLARIDLSDVAAATLTFVAVLSLGELSWRTRSPAERERLWVRRILPRTAVERRWWVLVSAGAAIAEEVAYRGVFVAIAAALTGSLAVGVVTSAVAFAIVHAPQGWPGIGYVFVIALVHQALVFATGTLFLAIVVHFAYDVLAGTWLAQRHGL